LHSELAERNAKITKVFTGDTDVTVTPTGDVDAWIHKSGVDESPTEGSALLSGFV
jgi:hypothetical protein